MEHHGPISWLLLIPGLSHDPRWIGVNASLVLFLFIALLSFAGRAALKGGVANYIVPSPKAKLSTLLDLMIESLHKMCQGTLGAHADEHFPFIATLFIFVWFSNLMGLIPLAASPSASLYTTVALGLASFVYYNVHGIRAHGFVGYCKHFLMGMGLAGIPIAFFEVISHVLRPVTLGLRLNLNIQIDHMLGTVFGSMAKYIVPVPLMIFGIVVCTIQAFLFATLTSVYLQMATEHEDHGHEGEHHH
ncbi:MAG: ATP synthase F0 subunit A [Proteobacteria bacterium]|nr:ATP synthase F0 subunit A [Pseudomonadota bacterium]